MTSLRVAVVTGSNKGIGFGIVRTLCKQLENGIVYLTARDEGRGKEAVAKLNQEGLQPKFHQLDINDGESVARLREHLKTVYGGVDILVNNAGIAFKRASTEPFGNQAAITMATDYRGTLDVCHSFHPILKPHGRIVNVSSMNGVKAFDELSEENKAHFRAIKTEEDINLLLKDFIEAAKEGDHKSKGWPSSAYGTVKLGLICGTKLLGEAVQKDRPQDDILIMACCPGHVRTDMSSQQGVKTIDEGADTPVYLALLSSGSTEFNGKMYFDRALVEFM
ncbi:carbonyl reductase [NADPH] 3-like [Asterias rubens]|uniref:carbonyl reductase [NADPH] 3-like n=1 Tax=Asterias rubens TaxID=7604 RepID=UPI0014550D6D|nr:carbonyl reductase [NADPH] 3-like [Asterias rubens]